MNRLLHVHSRVRREPSALAKVGRGFRSVGHSSDVICCFFKDSIDDFVEQLRSFKVKYLPSLFCAQGSGQEYLSFINIYIYKFTRPARGDHMISRVVSYTKCRARHIVCVCRIDPSSSSALYLFICFGETTTGLD